MKISDLQHLEVISEETKIEGGAFTISLGGDAAGTAATLISSSGITVAAAAGLAVNSSAFSKADTGAFFAPESSSGNVSVSGSLSSLTVA